MPATAFLKLNAALKAQFGHNLQIADDYRGYNAQVRIKAEEPELATTPGKSGHGWGLAFDVANGINDQISVHYKWMTENTEKFSFHNPDWLKDYNKANDPHEPWH